MHAWSGCICLYAWQFEPLSPWNGGWAPELRDTAPSCGATQGRAAIDLPGVVWHREAIPHRKRHSNNCTAKVWATRSSFMTFPLWIMISLQLRSLWNHKQMPVGFTASKHFFSILFICFCEFDQLGWTRRNLWGTSSLAQPLKDVKIPVERLHSMALRKRSRVWRCRRRKQRRSFSRNDTFFPNSVS